MAFGHAAAGNSKIYVGGYDLTAYLQGYSANGSRATAEVSTLADTFQQFLAGLQGGTASLNGFYDPATDRVVDALVAAFGSANKAAMIFPQGDTLGNKGIGLWGFNTALNINGDTGSAVTISADLQSNNGFGLGVSLHALVAVTGAGNGASVDNAAATTGGGESLLLVTAFNGTDATIVTADSADDSSFATIATHTQVTAGKVTDRQTVSGNVRRYLRYTISGTFTSITFALLFIRK